MKIRIFDHPETRKEKTVRLGLKQSDNNVVLVVLDKTGCVTPGGNLLEIRADGTFRRIEHVSHNLGFELDEMGKIHFAP